MKEELHDGYLAAVLERGRGSVVRQKVSIFSQGNHVMKANHISAHVPKPFDERPR